MLTIYCGDDTVSSRDALQAKRDAFIHEGRSIRTVDAKEIIEIIKNGGSLAADLFTGEPIYETTGLVAVYKRTYPRKAKEELKNVAADSSISVLDWETKSAYDLGLDKLLFVHESKVRESTFSLLPTCKPGNKQLFLQKLQDLTRTQAIEITFAMLTRHVRSMLFLSIGKRPKDAPFLVTLAQTCVRSWETPRLLKFYHQLLKIEVNMKTGRGTPLGVHQQLEVLASIAL